ncbi:transglycosylase SLT domain-containing protein [Streptomyces sp. NPDC059740]|uniref:transglycosylase SLT domain-containing protein n=1 Tax=Streptomyces sp. NPDC059740 TaxID=3346926 RepID=UPI00365A1CF2
MAKDTFGFEMGELAKVEKDWRTASRRLEEMDKKLAEIAGTLAKAAAVDLASSQLATLVPGFAVAFEVLRDVQRIHETTQSLELRKRTLMAELSQDADKIKQVKAEYEATEKKIEEHLKKLKEQHRGKDPGSPHTGSGGHPGRTGNGSGGDGGNGQGGDGGNGGDTGTPDGHQSNAAKIPVSDVSYGGAGTYKSGRDACKEYIDQALDKMGVTDPQARRNWEEGMLTVAQRESAYNSPNYQINLTDSNAHGAAAGDGHPGNCSRGGWQCIPSTFAAYHQPGTSTDIYDPVANCAASMNYMMSRYGVSADGSNLAAKVPQANPNAPGHGY